ncbi:Protein kinase domain [Macleaya cordata]|uniref:Protein kinase domain n=1 Tax=Macleaya cordata TaxID=56857 RepID=A0A200QK13_MACCD|nr:Protein kinase domain [Macleaya cordata]
MEEREANLLAAPPSPSKDKILADTNSNTSRSFTSSSFTSSPPGTMQSSSILPRRILLPQRERSKPANSNAGLTAETENSQVVASSRQANNVAEELIVQRNPYDSSITPPSFTGTVTRTDPTLDHNNVPQNISTFECQKKVQFSLDGKRADERIMATETDHLSSHMSSIALTEMDCDASSRVEISAVNSYDPRQRDSQQLEMPGRSNSGISSLLAKRSMLMQDQQHQLAAFVGNDISHPMTQSSVVDSSCVTTTSVHSRSAPMLNSTTYGSQSYRDSSFHMEIENLDVNPRPITPGIPQCPTFQCTSVMLIDQTAATTQASISALETIGVRDHGMSKGQQGSLLEESDGLKDGLVDHAKGSSVLDDKSNKGKGFSGDTTDVQSQAPGTKSSYSDTKLEPSKSDKPEKAVSGKGSSAPRKKSYDPDLFFKVNGKLYQKLGKIGSGGSSEVHKVISSDCTIYALKNIKLKGRDYSTAFGFCQEIEYLNKLKGKNNIIQLIDYEVTDKILLKEVMNGSMSIKDGRIRDDGYIYMVLEYGEIDLAHMLSQKWKEMDSSNLSMDENWLRFYWQQILQAVNTIHEQRIVHSDLKPANFLLVKGSLKLIDFGIAKAIMSDTTNIQRDSQVGTLSYMSPEAFMCNENDANGNAIKCGRPSDIWSLGCILYQMVYGRTPFAEYKTFWAKFKVITDRNHEITYGLVSNPWLLDLMKKCLAWDRNERWRIPQLLQHPFLVPPIPAQLSFPPQEPPRFKLLQQIAEAYGNDHEASRLCSQIQDILTEPAPPRTTTSSFSSTSQEQQCKLLLLQMSRLCEQLQQHIANIGKDVD